MRFTETQRRIFAVHERDPSLASRAIAQEVGCHHSHVATTLNRIGEWRDQEESKARAARRFAWAKTLFENLWRLEPEDHVVALALCHVLDSRTDTESDNEDGPQEREIERLGGDLLDSVFSGSEVEGWDEVVALARLFRPDVAGELTSEDVAALPVAIRVALAPHDEAAPPSETYLVSGAVE